MRPNRNTIAYSTSGSSSNNIVIAFVNELGAKAKPTATGGPPGTLTAVMSGQVDIGWAAPPFGLKEIQEGKIRIIARGSDVPSLRNQTVRVVIVNADALKAAQRRNPAVRQRLARGGRLDVRRSPGDQALCGKDPLYRRPDQEIGRPISSPRRRCNPTAIADIDGIVRDAVKLKFLDQPLSKEQLAEFFQVPPK